MVENWQDLMKTEIISSFGGFEILSRTIFLFCGQSSAGKTVTCLHLANEAIKNNKRVLYIDTEEKSILTRPQPNLFKEFAGMEPEKYKKFFKYTCEFDETKILDTISKEKPNLIIIDSLYQPFLHKYSEPRKRATQVKEFLTNLRGYVWDNSIGCILTTPVGRTKSNIDNVDKLSPLGGEGVKYLSDIKVLIKFQRDGVGDDYASKDRIFVIDKQAERRFEIKWGGHLEPIENGK